MSAVEFPLTLYVDDACPLCHAEMAGLAARDGGRVIALSRSDASSVAALRDWVLDTVARFRAGGLVPTDPGPMAPHFHAGDEVDAGQPHRHGSAGFHQHATGAHPH